MRLTLATSAGRVDIRDHTEATPERLTEWARIAANLLAETGNPPTPAGSTALVERAAQVDHETPPIGFRRSE